MAEKKWFVPADGSTVFDPATGKKVPVAGMALILGIDRFMSECRALTNFIGNAVATVVVARWEGALDQDRLKAAMAGTPLPLPEEDIERHERTSPHDTFVVGETL